MKTKEDIFKEKMLASDKNYLESEIVACFTDDDETGRLVRACLEAMEEYAAQAIAEHEAKQWHDYPEEKPERDDEYLVRVCNANMEYNTDRTDLLCKILLQWMCLGVRIKFLG